MFENDWRPMGQTDVYFAPAEVEREADTAIAELDRMRVHPAQPAIKMDRYRGAYQSVDNDQDHNRYRHPDGWRERGQNNAKKQNQGRK